MKVIIIIGGLLILLPNIFNSKERRAFSNLTRMQLAKDSFEISKLGDSVTVPVSGFYDKNAVHNFFYGKKYRKIWAEPVKMKVFDMDTVKGGMTALELGGGMQTIGLDLLSKDGKKFDMRSVNKDQSKALPKWLRITYLRMMFRDQVAAMNPYAALVVPSLADAVGIDHANPELYFVPYDERMDSIYRSAMAGRVVILEKNLNSSWAGTGAYRNVSDFYDTEEMWEKVEASDISIDTAYYLRCRLFDILINDWDRHEGQWEWALLNMGDSSVFRSYPKDRDMAFYDFRGGWVNSIALLFNKKFQSFTPEYKNVKALTHNSGDLDEKLLSAVTLKQFLECAENIAFQINDSVIASAFAQYPPEIYAMVGKKHEGILRARRDKLKDAAKKFYHALH